MVAQGFKKVWRCKGTSEHPHPEVENYNYKCDFLDCHLTYDDTKATQRLRKSLIILSISSVVAVAALGLAISSGIYVHQKLVEAEELAQQLKKTELEREKAQEELEQSQKELEQTRGRSNCPRRS